MSLFSVLFSGSVIAEIYYKGGSPVQYNEVRTAIDNPEVKSAEVMFMWNDIEPKEGSYDFSKVELLIDQWDKKGRKVALLMSSAHHSSVDTPRWLFENYGVRRINRGPWMTFDNEVNKEMYDLKGKVKVVPELNNTKSLMQNGGTKEELIFATLPGKVKTPYVLGTGEWSIQFDYFTSTGCTLKGASVSAGTQEDTKTLVLTKGQKGTASINLKSADYKNEFAFYISSGSVSIDNINMVEISNGWFGTTVLPNYFDETFKSKWQKLIEKVAQKYGKDERVDTVLVGGFGRWDEITLEDDVYETLLDQFPVYGFTNEKYLDHLKWCVDFYKKTFPDKKLLMSAFGHGTVKYMDRELINMRSGQYAMSQGVALKYNGHSGTSFDYNNILYNRYDSSVKKFYETYHQISREGNVGNPISVVSRALINKADVLYLYGYDSNDSKIMPSMKYANEALGGSLLTSFSAKFGEFPFYGEASGTSVVHSNINFGIRQKDHSKQSKPVYGSLLSEKYMATVKGFPLLRFDVDGPSATNGMSGATFTLRYFDEGTDLFCILSPDYKTLNYDDNLKTVLTVKKTNTKKWIEKSISLTEPMLSYEGDMDDNARDFLLDDRSDGTEKVSFVDLQFIPLGKYKMKEVGQTSFTGEFEMIAKNQKKTVSVQNNPEAPVSEITLPLGYADFCKVSDAFIEVFGKDNKGYHLVRNYLYYAVEESIPLKLVIPWTDKYSEYKITVTAQRDAIKWFKSKDGKITAGVYTYETEKEEAVKGKSAKITEKDGIKAGECEISVNRNFAGIQFPFVEGVDEITYRIDKKLPDGTIQKDIQSGSADVKNNSAVLYFPPLTPGFYTVYIETGGAGEISLTKKGLPIVPVEIISDVTPNKAYQSVYGKELISFDLKRSVPANVSLSKTDSGIILKPLGVSPSISIDFKKTTVKTAYNFRIKMANQTSCNLIRIALSSENSDPEKSLQYYLPVVSNDSTQREYSIFLSGEPENSESGKINIEFMGGSGGGQITIIEAQLRNGKTPTALLNAPAEQKILPITENYEKISDFLSVDKRMTKQIETFKKGLALIVILFLVALILIFIIRKGKTKRSKALKHEDIVNDGISEITDKGCQ